METVNKAHKPLDYEYATELINLQRANAYSTFKERNDCSVRAIATACKASYDAAHTFMAEVCARKNRKGAEHMADRLIKLEQEVQDIDGNKVVFKEVPRELIQNNYKVHGEIIPRKKTVKSFVQDFKVGTYLVFVSNHVFTVRDGVMHDNGGEEFRPTRKVLDAVQVLVEEKEQQMEFAFCI